MRITPTRIAGVVVVDTDPFVDHRGSFSRLFCERDLATALSGRHIVQINHSRTEPAGALRGVHYQLAPHAEMKLVRCIHGQIWDLALDLRQGSPTFLQWHAEELSTDNGRMLVIPEGCAHGFQTLQTGCELLYLHTAAYAKSAERGVRYDDPRAAIRWPLAVTDLSERDGRFRLLAPTFSGIQV